MFEDYLQDAYAFIELAKKASSEGDDLVAKRYFRSAVFCGASGLEAFVNYIADSFVKAGTLSPHEAAFLNDKTLVYVLDKHSVIEKPEYRRLEDKLRLLFFKFQPSFDFNNKYWSQFMEFKDLRDNLVHPRTVEDEMKVEEYEDKLKRGVSSIIQIMNILSTGIFKKPLRKQVLDLIPE